LPEAPKTSSHYQVLFAMGLLLFGLTFIVNTVAEIIRARVRMRVRGL
jgi:phosphate transport system permease protein